jgi:hypothetical protein
VVSFRWFYWCITQTDHVGEEYSAIDVRLQELNSSIDTVNGGVSELTNITQKLNSLLQLILNGVAAPSSCATLPHSFPSGYYWVRAPNGSAVRVYCDMTRLCGGVTGGWMRVAELDMTNSSHQCPSGLRQRTDSNIHTCVRIEDTNGCSSAGDFTNSYGIEYTKVCGRIIGYQFGSPEA